MNKETNSERADSSEQDIVLISKIYESFEALEETLGKLKLEEPLFITHVAKKSFADTIFSTVQKNNDRKKTKNASKTDNSKTKPRNSGALFIKRLKVMRASRSCRTAYLPEQCRRLSIRRGFYRQAHNLCSFWRPDVRRFCSRYRFRSGRPFHRTRP